MDMGVPQLVPLAELTRRALAPGSLGFTLQIQEWCRVHSFHPERMLRFTGRVTPNRYKVLCSDGRERYISALVRRYWAYQITESAIRPLNSRDALKAGDFVAVYVWCSCTVRPFKLSGHSVGRLGTGRLEAVTLGGYSMEVPLLPSAHGVWLVEDFMTRPATLDELVEGEVVYLYNITTDNLVVLKFRGVKEGYAHFDKSGGSDVIAADQIGPRCHLVPFRVRSLRS